MQLRSSMELVADRFALMDERHVVDLATGGEVTLTIGTAGGASEQASWATRCDGLQKLHHRFVARLLDYGMIGDSQRFEAWDCFGSWSGAAEEADHARRAASLFLSVRGLTASESEERGVLRYRSHPVVIPDFTAASEVLGEAELPLEACGLSIIEPPALSGLTELFRFQEESRPRIVALVGPSGSGKTTLVLELARAARLGGLIPVSIRLARQLELQDHRSLCLIDDDSCGTRWPTLLETSLRWPRPHVVIATASEEIRGVHSIAMVRVSPETLVAAVRPRALSAAALRRVRMAAVKARGLPGRFARILWPERPLPAGRGYNVSSAPLSRVAEQATTYKVEALAGMAPVAVTAAPQERQWRASGDLAVLRRRMAAAVGLIDAGRHAPGIRDLRRTVGALARRNLWSHARDGALALGAGLLKRGRPRDAQAALDAARQYCNRMGQEAGLTGMIDVAAMYSDAWIDLARLDEAEACASSAVAAARAAGDPTRTTGPARALARCLFWRGQYADAASLLDQIRDTPLDASLETMRLAITCLDARVAVGRRDTARAMECAAAAVDRANLASARDRAEAYCTAGFVHLAAGDLDAAERDVGAARSAARTARDPVRAVHARLILVETERRRGRRRAAAAEAARLRRLHAMLPPLVRARCNLAGEVVSSDRPPSEVLARHVAATGLAALALWLPAGAAEGSGVDPLTSEVVSILQLCQTAEDESHVLAQVCDRVCRHLHAAGVAWIAADIVLASAGGRMDPGVAMRAVAAGVAIAPHRSGDRIEAGAPVCYGGSTICGLAARWTPGSSYDLSRAADAMAMVAAASAPVVAAALARRQNRPAPGVGELLGVTPAIADLRRTIERAAAAPFGVLVEGESGSGKELVARAIHRGGPRRGGPFCTLNCAALPEDLVEAELFGHTRGAFTGAVADRAGVFEEAHGGTLFLDEIGELSARAQAKVLRVIQEGELRRVGENVSRRIDVRIVAATNRDLAAEASAGRFRVDLLYRLDVIRIRVPPLRERAEDIAVLVEHFWREAADRMGSRATLGASTVAALARYDWPGNVRELQNVLAALAVRSPRYGVVPPTALPPQFAASRDTEAPRLTDARRIFEERFVRAALVRTGGHRGRAASDLGVTRQGLTKLMARLGISD